MKKSENKRNLIIFVAFLVLNIAICVMNVINLNIIALILDMTLIISICFILGYIYCRYEEEKEPVEVTIDNHISYEQLQQLQKSEKEEEI